MIIAFTGAQGVGKTTLLNELRKNPKFKDYIFIDEITREVKKQGYEINENGTDDTQIVIMSKHINNIKKGPNLIMDRCALDCLVYSAYLYMKSKITFKTYQKILFMYKQLIKDYDKIFFIEPEFDLVKDGVRSENKQFRKDIADIFRIFTKDLKVIKLSGSVEERLKTIYENIA